MFEPMHEGYEGDMMVRVGDEGDDCRSRSNPTLKSPIRATVEWLGPWARARVTIESERVTIEREPCALE